MTEDEAWMFSIRAARLLEECSDRARRARMRDRAIDTLGDSAWTLPFTLAVEIMNKCPVDLRDERGHPSSRLLLPAVKDIPSAFVVASLLRKILDHPSPGEAAVSVRRILIHTADFVDANWEFLTDPEDQNSGEAAKSRFRGLATEPHGIETVTDLYLGCLDAINGSTAV